MGDAMDAVVSCETKEEAEQVIALLTEAVQYKEPNLSREDARKVTLKNVGYCSVYFGPEEALRIMELFDTTHPVFGRLNPTPKEAFEAGQDMAAKGRNYEPSRPD